MNANETIDLQAPPRPAVAERPTLDLSGFSHSEPVDPISAHAAQAKSVNAEVEQELLEPTDSIAAGDLAEGAKEAPLKTIEQAQVVDTTPKGVSLKQKAIAGVAGIAAIVAVVVMLGGRTAAPTSVPNPVSVKAPHTPTPATPVPSPATPSPTGPGSVEVFHADGSPDSAARLESETAADLQPWPANQRSCDAPGLTGYDRDVCAKEGPVMYFKCAPDGRRWDISLPGCDRG